MTALPTGDGLLRLLRADAKSELLMPGLLLRDAIASPTPCQSIEQVEFKIADDRNQRSAAFRLVYHAYIRAGLIEANPSQMRVTPYQLQSSCDVFVAMLREEVISTVSLIADGPRGLPMESIYAEEISQLRASGLRFGEVSALADRRRQLSRTLPVFVRLMRLMVQNAHRKGLDRLLVAVHPRHARFYQRFLSFRPLAEERSYPLVCNHPAVALYLDFAEIHRDRPPNYELFFGDRLPDEQVLPRPMPASDIEFFAEAARFGDQFTVMGPDEAADA